MAGIVAASAGNSEGVAGVASNLKIHITRALGDDGRGYESDIRAAVEQCIEAAAKVINLSLGGPYMASRSEEFYTRFVQEYGVMMFAAAGNDGNQAPVYPAGHPDIISVSAVGDSGIRWTGSSYGSQTELSAPGQNVLSTYASNAAVHISGGTSYPASTVNGSPGTSASGKMELCDASDDKCGADICLYQKSASDQVSKLVEACEKGGGAGMIVFTASNQAMDTWSAASSIPVVSVSLTVGRSLKNDHEGDDVTIGDIGEDDIEYSYHYLTGTSMASPHAAAGAALLWSNFPDCSNHQIRYALAVTADHPDGGCDNHMGYGVIQLKDAYDWLMDDPCDQWDVSQISTGGCTTLHQ